MVRRIIGRTKHGKDIAAWMLKANPGVWDVVAWASDHDWIDSWRLAHSYRVPMMKPGDLCFLWVTGPANSDYEPGLWAAGIVTGDAADDTGGGSMWVDSVEKGKRRPYIPLNLRILEQPIARADIGSDPRFGSSEIIRQPQMGNPLVVSSDELLAIEDRIDGLDRLVNELADLDRAREEAPRTPDFETAESWGDGYRDMLYAFANAGLTAPPVPEPLRPRLQRLGPWSWSTRQIDPFAMYMFDEYIDEAIVGRIVDYVAVSHAGHGFNSYGLNYHLVHGSLGIFTQDGWGGAYMNPVLSRVQVATTFSRVHEFIEGSPQYAILDAPPRVILAWSRFRMVCSGALQVNAGAEVEWVNLDGQEALFALGAHLVGLLPAARADRRSLADRLIGSLSEHGADHARSAAAAVAGNQPSASGDSIEMWEWEAAYLDALIAEMQRINGESREP